MRRPRLEKDQKQGYSSEHPKFNPDPGDEGQSVGPSEGRWRKETQGKAFKPLTQHYGAVLSGYPRHVLCDFGHITQVLCSHH